MATRRARVGRLAKDTRRATTGGERRAIELLGLIARRKARISEDFYEIGLALRELKDKKLFVALGFRSFAELLEARQVMSLRTAEKLIEVVKAVPRGRALELGAEKSYALARLAAATPQPDDAESILTEGVVVRGKRRGVETLSTRAIEEVARAVRPRRTPSAAAKQLRADARALRSALRAAGLSKAKVTEQRAAVTIRLPGEAIEVLVRALR